MRLLDKVFHNSLSSATGEKTIFMQKAVIAAIFLAASLVACGGEIKSDQQLFTNAIGDSYGKLVKVARENPTVCDVRFANFGVFRSQEGAEQHANQVLQQIRVLTHGSGVTFLSAARRVKVSGKENDAWIAVVVGCAGPAAGGGGSGGAQ
jgi:hypothetical protein